MVRRRKSDVRDREVVHDMPPCLGFPRERATHQICLMKEGGIRTASTTVRLSSCLEASGVQATPRNARIDVEDVCHVMMNIGPSAGFCIATKARTSPQDVLGLPIGRLGACSARGRARRDRSETVSGRHHRRRASCRPQRGSLLPLASFHSRVFAAPDSAWREYGGG